MRLTVICALTLAACSGKTEGPTYSSDTDPTIDRPVDSGDSGDTADTSETGETDTAETDTGETDTSETDTGETGDTGETDTGDTGTSLYDQLGGAAGVAAVVDAFIVRVAGDDVINWMFADTDIAHLTGMLNDQICAATGGPCTYKGGSMLEVHASMAITNAQWDSLVHDLLLALTDVGVPYSPDFDGTYPADTLILALAGMHDDIVTDGDGSGVLFNQLGGHGAVVSVIDGLIGYVGADDRINGFFASTDLTMLNALLVQQVCDATGGYCTYHGRDMVTAHATLGICDAHFDALVEDLLLSMTDLGVPFTAGTFDGGLPADTLIMTLAGMRTDIVTATCPS